ncbi:MAG: arsenite methyltransferase [Verrucomicrobiota bacterium]
MKTLALKQDAVRQTVRERYGKIAESGGSCGCGPACCAEPAEASEPCCDHESDTCCATESPKDSSAAAVAQTLGYSAEQTGAVPEGANLGLGCGNPLAIASLRAGQTVLDLGSGAGFDAFLAAKAVGPQGRVIGVDMTAAMVSQARKNREKGDYEHVEFRLGEIESLPVADASVDVIISNCVINLSPDKGRVFREAFRVLKAGGRLAISDVVAFAPIPESLRGDWELYTGCVAGAASVEELRTMLAGAGFAQIRIERKSGSREIINGWFPGKNVGDYVASATIEATKPAA